MSALLELENVESGYGATPIIFGVSLNVEQGEALALVGRNGMGKSTIIRTILGLCRATAGSVRMNGVDVTHFPSHRIARTGIAWVPEGRLVFSNLTVRENLIATSANYAGGESHWNLAEIFSLFPGLKDRSGQLGSQLSGGEAQMLAIGRALMLGPRLLLLDEATEGLAPVIRDEIWSTIRRLRERNVALIIVDKDLDALARFATRAAVVEKGRIVWSGATQELAGDADLHDRYLVV